MAPASLQTYSARLHETDRARASLKKSKVNPSTEPKQGSEMKCAAPKTALPALSTYKR